MLRELRTQLTNVLRTDPELDAFCLDYFSEVYCRFTQGMDRITKVNLLLTLAEPSEISRALNEQAHHRMQSVSNILCSPLRHPEPIPPNFCGGDLQSLTKADIERPFVTVFFIRESNGDRYQMKLPLLRRVKDTKNDIIRTLHIPENFDDRHFPWKLLCNMRELDEERTLSEEGVMDGDILHLGGYALAG